MDNNNELPQNTGRPRSELPPRTDPASYSAAPQESHGPDQLPDAPQRQAVSDAAWNNAVNPELRSSKVSVPLSTRQQLVIAIVIVMVILLGFIGFIFFNKTKPTSNASGGTAQSAQPSSAYDFMTSSTIEKPSQSAANTGALNEQMKAVLPETVRNDVNGECHISESAGLIEIVVGGRGYEAMNCYAMGKSTSDLLQAVEFVQNPDAVNKAKAKKFKLPEEPLKVKFSSNHDLTAFDINGFSIVMDVPNDDTVVAYTISGGQGEVEQYLVEKGLAMR